MINANQLKELKKKGFQGVDDAAVVAWAQRQIAAADKYLRTKYPNSYSYTNSGRLKPIPHVLVPEISRPTKENKSWLKIKKEHEINGFHIPLYNKTAVFAHPKVTTSMYVGLIAHENRHSVDAKAQGRIAMSTKYGGITLKNTIKNAFNKEYQADVRRIQALEKDDKDDLVIDALNKRDSKDFDNLSPVFRNYVTDNHYEKAADSWAIAARKSYEKDVASYHSLSPGLKNALKSHKVVTRLDKYKPLKNLIVPQQRKYYKKAIIPTVIGAYGLTSTVLGYADNISALGEYVTDVFRMPFNAVKPHLDKIPMKAKVGVGAAIGVGLYG